jgi:hypothetical protein
MNSPPHIDDDDRQAIGLALGYFLSNRVEEGRTALSTLRPEILESLYTAGLRLGIEAQSLLPKLGKTRSSSDRLDP